VINSTGVYVLARPADKTAPYTQSQVGTLSSGSYVVTADVNGDGRPETVVSDSGAGTIGYWQKPVVQPAPAPIEVITDMPATAAATQQPTAPAVAPPAAAPTTAAAPTAPTAAGAPTVAGDAPVPAPTVAGASDSPTTATGGDAPPDIAPPLQGQTLQPSSSAEPTPAPTAAETAAATPLLNAAVTLSGGFRIYTSTTAGVVPSPGQLVGGIMSALGLRVAELTVSLTALSASEQQAQQHIQRSLAAPAPAAAAPAAAAAAPAAAAAQSDAPYVDAAFKASFRAGGAAGLNVGAGTFADGSAGSTSPSSSDETASTAAARAVAALSSTGASLVAAAVGVPSSAVLLLAVVACKEGLEGGCMSAQLDSSTLGMPPAVLVPPGNGVIYFFGLFFLLLVATAGLAWAALELLLRHYKREAAAAKAAAAASGRSSGGASPRKPQLHFTPHRRRKQRPAKTQPYPLCYSPEQQQQWQQQQQQHVQQHREPVPSPAGSKRPKQLFDEHDDELVAVVPGSPFHLASALASTQQQQETHSSNATESSRASSSSASHSRWHSSITAQVYAVNTISVYIVCLRSVHICVLPVCTVFSSKDERALYWY
jgi:hypothetical protein